MNLPTWAYDIPWLTVRQPWADLLVAGVKDVENRTWQPPSTLPQWGRCSECHNRVPPTSRLRHRDSRHLHARLWPNPPGPCGQVEWDDGPFPFRLGIHAAAAKAHYNFADLRSLVITTPDANERILQHAVKVSGSGWYKALLGTVEVTGCHHAHECQDWDDDDLDDAALYCSRWADLDVYHWTLSDPEPLPARVAWKGRQGLWRIAREAAA